MGTPLIAGGGGALTSHPNLSDRNLADQHTIASITDLQSTIDRVDQNPTNLGNLTGAITIDLTKGNMYGLLTGDVTSIGFSNGLTGGKSTAAIISVTQDATTARSMDWSGSGVYSEQGLLSADLEPSQVLGSVTQYWLYWAGNLGYWTITKIEIDTTSL